MNTQAHLSLFLCLSVSLLGCSSSSSLPERCEDRNPVFVDGKKNKEEWRCNKDGSWRLAGSWRDDKKHGKWTNWYKLGNEFFKQREVEYKDGEKHGKWTEWHRNGQKWAEGEYKDGKIHGKETIWLDTGQKNQEAEYKDGERYGKWTSWHDNGQKRQEGQFKDGKHQGKFTFWSPNGQVGEGKYEDGMPIGIFRMFMVNTPITCERKEAVRTCLYANGKRASESTWIEGVRSDRKCWDEAGKEMTPMACNAL